MIEYRVFAEVCREGYELPPWYSDSPCNWDAACEMRRKLREWDSQGTAGVIVTIGRM
jgi:hypothetical protein